VGFQYAACLMSPIWNFKFGDDALNFIKIMDLSHMNIRNIRQSHFIKIFRTMTILLFDFLYKFSNGRYTHFGLQYHTELPRNTLRGSTLKKGKPSNRRISEVYHHQPSISLVRKATYTISFLRCFKRAVQNLTKLNVWGENVVECSVQTIAK
jgi:hypothetical protein